MVIVIIGNYLQPLHQRRAHISLESLKIILAYIHCILRHFFTGPRMSFHNPCTIHRIFVDLPLINEPLQPSTFCSYRQHFSEVLCTQSHLQNAGNVTLSFVTCSKSQTRFAHWDLLPGKLSLGCTVSYIILQTYLNCNNIVPISIVPARLTELEHSSYSFSNLQFWRGLTKELNIRQEKIV